ncbi:precorrin-3B methylase [Nocardiopsis arvandica]|uniref:Precorrin-3B methylase n=1 Tax=Nocardiopsis sinuspersici TaxID=501010 RepID=A0A7Y9XC56_9ACTN|nr:precorrin-3B methylase [Nocardiopsis sinuspersici]
MRVQSVVLVGSSDSRTVVGRLVAPRGYTWSSAEETVP